MKYFCETQLDSKPHFFISEIELRNDKIKSYAIEDNSTKIQDLNKNISIFNSMMTPHNILYIYMMLSELCVDDTARKYFNKKASEYAYRHLEAII